MKPPVNIDDLMKSWVEDAVVNETDPHRTLAQIPNLHAKYLNIMTYHNLKAKYLAAEYAKLKTIMTEYYSGNLNNPDDLKEYGLEPFQYTLTRVKVDQHVASDKKLNDILMKKMINEEIVEYCRYVLKELNNRTFQIRTHIDWLKYTNG